MLTLGCGSRFDLQQPLTDGTPSAKSQNQEDDDYTDYSDFALPDALEAERPPQDSSNSPSPKPQPRADAPKAGSDSTAPGESAQGPETPKDSQDSSRGPRASQVMVGVGSIYYMPVYGETRSCKPEMLAKLKTLDNQVLATLCRQEIADCAMQGSCFYKDSKGVRLFAFHQNIKIIHPETKKEINQPRFKLNTLSERCPQGMGVRNICLDPYRSIAADPRFHKIGDVIFIPKLRGQKLPNDEIHDGYMVIRDTGGRIKGKGRFDFFIGFDDWRGHLFTRLGLSDVETSRFEYLEATAEIAEKVRQFRRFPLAPKKVHETALAKLNLPETGVTHVASLLMTNAFYQMKYTKNSR